MEHGNLHLVSSEIWRSVCSFSVVILPPSSVEQKQIQQVTVTVSLDITEWLKNAKSKNMQHLFWVVLLWPW